MPAGHVLVADEVGRADAMLLAEALTQRGRRVTLATSCLHVGEDEGITTLYPLLRLLGQLGVELLERVRVTAFDGVGGAPREPVGRPRRRPSTDVDAILHWSGGDAAVRPGCAAARRRGSTCT